DTWTTPARAGLRGHRGIGAPGGGGRRRARRVRSADRHAHPAHRRPAARRAGLRPGAGLPGAPGGPGEGHPLDRRRPRLRLRPHHRASRGGLHAAGGCRRPAPDPRAHGHRPRRVVPDRGAAAGVERRRRLLGARLPRCRHHAVGGQPRLRPAGDLHRRRLRVGGVVVLRQPLRHPLRDDLHRAPGHPLRPARRAGGRPLPAGPVDGRAHHRRPARAQGGALGRRRPHVRRDGRRGAVRHPAELQPRRAGPRRGRRLPVQRPRGVRGSHPPHQAGAGPSRQPDRAEPDAHRAGRGPAQRRHRPDRRTAPRRRERLHLLGGADLHARRLRGRPDRHPRRRHAGPDRHQRRRALPDDLHVPGRQDAQREGGARRRRPGRPQGPLDQLGHPAPGDLRGPGGVDPHAGRPVRALRAPADLRRQGPPAGHRRPARAAHGPLGRALRVQPGRGGADLHRHGGLGAVARGLRSGAATRGRGRPEPHGGGQSHLRLPVHQHRHGRDPRPVRALPGTRAGGL
ncbi:MAG: hypothetical protein AVDCRST_MAG07-1811, partial [uncultured Frankineae bacterium]